MNELKLDGKLVNAQQLLEALFTPESRPSLRWLRTQTETRAIPFVRLGRLVFFDVELVRTALLNKHLVRGRFLPAV
ncbi:MAG: hypothetical protein EPO07_11515 [Verrucomicrobia bacterium]|nr:MAG: hypothetical protein EPO07_11515 [Verrucomicrobiota bacterium]